MAEQEERRERRELLTEWAPYSFFLLPLHDSGATQCSSIMIKGVRSPPPALKGAGEGPQDFQVFSIQRAISSNV